MRTALFIAIALILIIVILCLFIKAHTRKKLKDIDGVLGITKEDDNNGKVIGGSL